MSSPFARQGCAITGAITAVFLGATSSNAQTFGIVADFSTVSNPNGPWTYNKADALLPRVDDWLGRGPAWAIAGVSVPGHIPTIMISDNPEAVFIHGWDPGSGLDYGAPNIKWTSPSAGHADISGFAYTVDYENRRGTWSISINGNTLTTGSLFPGDPYDQSNPLSFSAGTGGAEVLRDIAVVPGTVIALQWDTTSLGGGALFFGDMSINLTAVPEPSNCAMIAGVGLLGFVAWRRRKATALGA